MVNHQEMAMLHLRRYSTISSDDTEMPFAMTLDGIGIALGITRAHVSIVVSKMEEKGLLEMVQARVNGCRSKRGVYILTDSGYRRSSEINRSLLDSGISPGDLLKQIRRDQSPNLISADTELERASRAIKLALERDDRNMLKPAIEHMNRAMAAIGRELI